VRCHEARGALLETLTGRTPPDTRRAVAAHLTVCPACRQEAAALEETVALLRSAPAPVPPEGFWGDFMVRLGERIERTPVSIGARLRRWVFAPSLLGPAAATAVALIILIVSSLAQLPEPVSAPSTRAQVTPFLTESMKTFLPALAETVELWQSGLGELEAEPLLEPLPESP